MTEQSPRRGAVVITGASTGSAGLRARPGRPRLPSVRRRAQGRGRGAPAQRGLDRAAADRRHGRRPDRGRRDRVSEEVGAAGLAGLVEQRRHRCSRPARAPADRRVPPPDRGEPGRPGRRHPGVPAAARDGAGRMVTSGRSVARRAADAGPYAASKHAMEGISDSLRRELRPWGMQVSHRAARPDRAEIWETGTRPPTSSWRACRRRRRTTAKRSRAPGKGRRSARARGFPRVRSPRSSRMH